MKTNLEKAKELLQKMTLTEKVGQLCMKGACNLDAQGVPDSVDLVKMIEEGRLGHLIQRANDMHETTDYLQKLAVEKTRLHIPLFINTDMIHGLETVYPTPIASACSFDTALVEECAKAQAEETRICGIHHTNAPMVDVSRDPRWGRVVESQGEDPYLAGEMGKAYVRGLQNEENYVMATLKHFAGYGAVEGGRDYNVCEMSENTMLNTYLIPFREGVKEGADSIMTAFNSIENVPATGNKKYLREILRGKFGFNGIALSDAISAYEMIPYGYCKDLSECAYRCIIAGLDVDLGSDVYPFELEKLVLEGKVPESLVDEAVLRVLTKKFELGLFENPYSQSEKKDKIMCKEYLDLSYKMALESAVLLENDGVLPLKKDAKIALVGKFSTSRDMLGCWQESNFGDKSVTVYEGLQNAGFTVVGVVDGYDVKQAEKAIECADVVIFNFGETSQENGEARSHYNLHLPKEVLACYNVVKGKNKKVVSLLFTGRPLIMEEVLTSNALVCCWNLGHRAGDAIATLLSGEANFSAKLAITFPKHEGQIPLYYARKKLGRPYQPHNQEWRFQARYDDGMNEPDYVFGYGKSYSKFVYGAVQLNKTEMAMDDTITASVEITNDSDVTGTEIVQLYINDCVSEVVRPIKELKGFQRVNIQPHQTVKVEFTIDKEKLEYYHEDSSLCADKGNFEVFIGADSRVEEKVKFTLK